MYAEHGLAMSNETIAAAGMEEKDVLEAWSYWEKWELLEALSGQQGKSGLHH